MPRAAVCTQRGEPLEILDLVLEEPRAGEIKVQIGASGICASDASYREGHLPGPIPAVLGHEAAGVVTAIGEGVTELVVGDHAIISAQLQCGTCFRCARDQHNLCELGDKVLVDGALPDGTSRFTTQAGADVRQMVATGTFSEEVVVSEWSAVKIPKDISFVPASLIGCAVLTGAGAALNAASIRDGYSVAVIGCGSVGLCAIQGARMAGAGEIIAVDMIAGKLAMAERVGATATVASGDDVVEEVRRITGGRGADVTIEAVGAQATVDQAISMTALGGEVVFVGAGGKDTRINVRQFTGLVGCGKTFTGCLFGSANIAHDVPRLVASYQAGEFELDALISETFSLEQVNEGLATLGAGDTVSAVVDFN